MGGVKEHYFGQSRKFHLTRVELPPSSATPAAVLLTPVKRFAYGISWDLDLYLEFVF